MSPGAAAGNGGAGARSRWAILAAWACLCLIFFLGVGWDGIARPGAFSGRKNDYYSQLVHGFISGHLYLDRSVDPRMDSTDPKVRAVADWPLDASYYNHRYYLYYGVTPAALFLLPYDWLTGGDIAPGLLVAPLVMAGFLLAFCTWRMAARDCGVAPRPVFDACAALALGLGTAAPQLLTRQMFYEIPVACGYACVSAAALFLYRALGGRGRPAVQLALASLCGGLAVGCRPDLILALPAVAAVALIVSRRNVQAGGPARAWLAAVLPAAAVGAGLGTYNFERFGSPWDFGFAHGINKFFSLHDPLGSPGFLWTNLRWDFLTPPSLSPYFPFVYPESASFRPPHYHSEEAIHGQFLVFLLVVFVVASAIAMRRRVALGRTGTFLGVLCWMSGAPFLALGFLGLRADRYFVDFQPPLVLATIILASLTAAAASRSGCSRRWTAAFSALALAASGFGFFAGVQQFEKMRLTRPQTYAALERVGNLPSYVLLRLGALKAGPVHLRVTFPRKSSGASIEPLLNTGSPDRTDTVYVNESAGDMIEFVSDHHGYGGERSGLIHVVPGRVYDVRVDMGSLYPPLNHRFFADYGITQARLMKSRVKVWLDDQLVLDDRMDSYDSPPWNVELGRNDMTLNPYSRRFSGVVLLQGRLPVEAARSPAKAPLTGLWRIRCRLPAGQSGGSYPVLSLGRRGAGVLVSMQERAGGRVSFGVDEWGYQPVTSDAEPVDLTSDHVVEIFAGPLVGQYDWNSAWGIRSRALGLAASRLQVWLDGRLVCSVNLHRVLDPVDKLADVGGNLEGFSSAEMVFPGPIAQLDISEAEGRAFLMQNLPPMIREDDGAWRIRFKVPAGDAPMSYPLLIAGEQGAGTLVFGSFDGRGGLVLGFDQWGHGGAKSGALGAPKGTEHVAEVLIGPLAAKSPLSVGPSKVDPSRIRVWFDGALAIDAKAALTIGPPESYMQVGSNYLGFSTAQQDFPDFILPENYTPQEEADFFRKNANLSH
ncbi:MAG TPA: hypothetical protein VGG34_12325 [Opitutaceae bacterium]|jgi:hypothetical protein